MKSMKLPRCILACEMTGFVIVIIFLWVDELFDLPHRILGAPSTFANIRESIFETAIILVLAAAVIFITDRLLKRIVSGILPICSFCKYIRMDDRWVPLDSFLRDHSHVDFSHGVCPLCAAENYGEFSNVKDPGKGEKIS